MQNSNMIMEKHNSNQNALEMTNVGHEQSLNQQNYSHDPEAKLQETDLQSSRTFLDAVRLNFLNQRKNCLRHSLNSEQVEAQGAFGGKLSLVAAQNALQIVELLDKGHLEDIVKHQSLTKITSRSQRLNQLLLMYGLAVTNQSPTLFEYSARKLGDRLGDYPADYSEARTRTDSTLRQLLELVLIGCILCSDIHQTHNTLKYGRSNTFLLSVTDDVLQIALRVTEDDGPLKGDKKLLRIMIENSLVVKPQRRAIQALAIKKNPQKEKKLLTIMKTAARIEFKKILQNQEAQTQEVELENSEAALIQNSSQEILTDLSNNETIEQLIQKSDQNLALVKEHYLQAHDFLEVQYSNIERGFCSNAELVKIIVSLIKFQKFFILYCQSD